MIRIIGTSGTIRIIEVDDAAFEGLRAAADVAFDDVTSVPVEYREVSTEIWSFFNNVPRAS